jgi:hypothetical protein
LFTFFVNAQPASGPKLRANKPQEAANNPENDHHDAQDADSKTGMVQIFHRVHRLVEEREQTLQERRQMDASYTVLTRLPGGNQVSPTRSWQLISETL